MRPNRGARAALGVLAIALMLAGVAGASRRASLRLSANVAGQPGNAGSFDADLSPDGGVAAFTSEATNLEIPALSTAGAASTAVALRAAQIVPTPDDNGLADIFVHDVLTGATIRVSEDSAGGQANGPSGEVSVSADGRSVAFSSRATNLVREPVTPGSTQIYLHDVLLGRTTLITTDGDNRAPVISADGSRIAFEADSNLVPADGNGVTDVYAFDTRSGSIELVSATTSGEAGNGASHRPSISADGRAIAFDSEASNLGSFDPNGVADVYVRGPDGVRLASQGHAGPGDGPSTNASLSSDGSTVAFASLAALDPRDNNLASDVYVAAVDKPTRLISIPASGEPAEGSSFDAALSGAGRVAFASEAGNLDPGSSQPGHVAVYVADLGTGAIELVSTGQDGMMGASRPAISDGGTVVAYTGDFGGITHIDGRIDHDRCENGASETGPFSGPLHNDFEPHTGPVELLAHRATCLLASHGG